MIKEKQMLIQKSIDAKNNKLQQPSSRGRFDIIEREYNITYIECAPRKPVTGNTHKIQVGN